MRYTNACDRAAEISREESCTIHVTCRVRKAPVAPILARRATDAEPSVDPLGYGTNDWYDGSVVATYTNGERTDL